MEGRGNSMEAQRLTELAIQLTDGKPNKLITLLRMQGKEVEAQTGNVYKVRWPDGSFVTAFHVGMGLPDSVQQLFIVLFGIMGLALPLYGEVQKAITKEFKKRRVRGRP